MAIENLTDLLDVVADDHIQRGLIAYPSGDIENARDMKYKQLRLLARYNAHHLSQIEGFSTGSVILVHFNDQLDNIIWFWSVVYSGCIPVMSTPFVNNLEQREKHIVHLHHLLRDPICITKTALLADFATKDILKVYTIENLASTGNDITESSYIVPVPLSSDLALLMLTSGSTGNAKAVCLSHGQILASMAGKSSVKRLPADKPFLNWIGIDHVASLLEIHLQALYLNIDQVHVQAVDLISNPLTFLKLLSRHHVVRSFAPNFFLAKLRRAIESSNVASIEKDLDLSCLWWMGSGGEANTVETCEALSKLFSKYGAPENAIIPGFGMTETCAGAIFNLDCPRYDLQHQRDFTSLGICMKGIEMRVTIPSESESGRRVSPNELGDLEVKGPVVFKGYYNNPSATSAAFTADGWFKTGDQAMIDDAGNLNLTGRLKETMTINGIKYQPFELEVALDEASILGLTPSYTVCFSYRPKGSQTEQICVIYLPTYSPDDIDTRTQTLDAVVQVVMLQTGVRPYVLPLDEACLQKSSLGKISRAKVRTAFENGNLKEYQDNNDGLIRSHRGPNYKPPANKSENILLQAFKETLEIHEDAFGVETRVFEIGVTSIDLIRLKRCLEKVLQMSVEIPMITMMTNPTVRTLAIALENLQGPARDTYNPVVVLQHQGRKTPLWLIHPGVGEILVFLGLAKYLIERPVYALRARGFNNDETPFQSIDEAVQLYYTAIKTQQPEGPYALAGYSYGSMLAFETAKMLERKGNDVRFLGCLNLPPHIKTRMRQLGWTECLLNLAYFLDLITEQRAYEAGPGLQGSSREEALAYVVDMAAPARMAELALTSEALIKWVDVAFALQSMARDYEPTDSVGSIDVFYAIPLRTAARSKKEWLDEHLSKWADFCRSTPVLHEVGGAHYTMIGSEHVGTFQAVLRRVLEDRGL
ncbi:hypothetical protein MMC14_004892 [Varicellaria rhodocarpa]|nr:hypothetical protein [Varicellaria rhodocarpa]